MDIAMSNEGKGFQKWGLVGTLLWGLLIALVFIVVQLVVMVIYIGLNYRDVTAAEFQKLMTALMYNGTVISICTFASLLVCGCMILIIVKIKKGSNLKHYLGLKRVDFTALKIWFPILVAFLVSSDALTIFLGRPIVPEYMSTVCSSAESLWLLYIAIIVAAPIFEELFFRGFLFSGLKSSIIGPVGAILVSSLLWAAIHLQYDMYGLATIFIMGIGLGIARLKSGSILLTIGLHSFSNLVATIEAMIFISK